MGYKWYLHTMAKGIKGWNPNDRAHNMLLAYAKKHRHIDKKVPVTLEEQLAFIRKKKVRK